MSGISAQEAIDKLKNNPGLYTTKESLLQLVREVNADASGKVTLLYSGLAGNGIKAGDIVKNIGAELGDARVISNTDAYKFLDSDAFLNKVAEVFNATRAQLDDPHAGHPGNKFLNDPFTCKSA